MFKHVHATNKQTSHTYKKWGLRIKLTIPPTCFILKKTRRQFYVFKSAHKLHVVYEAI